VKTICIVLMLTVREMMALALIGAIIFLVAAAWQFLAGGVL
jgi:hypothetical protein